MKVKEVHYERVFSLPGYNNEKIRLQAELEQKENPEAVMGELFFKVASVEEVLQKYRTLCSRVECTSQRIAQRESSIRDLEQRISDLKVKISELDVQAKRGAIDSKLRHACTSESYTDLQERLKKERNRLKALNKNLEELIAAKEELRGRISKGDFTLEGLEIPEIEVDPY